MSSIFSYDKKTEMMFLKIIIALMILPILAVNNSVSFLAKADNSSLSITVDPQNLQVAPNTDFAIAINISSASNVTSVYFDLNFNPSLIKFVKSTEGAFMPQGGCQTFLMSSENPAGTLIVGLTSLKQSSCDGASGSGTLMTLNFKTLSQSGTSSMNFSNNGVYANWKSITSNGWSPINVTITGLAQSIPTINGVSPAVGVTAGGTDVAITGTQFAAGATVTIGGNPAVNVNVVNDTKITATTPAGTTGATNVIVTNVDGGTATLTGAFTYQASSVSFSRTPSTTPQSPFHAGDSTTVNYQLTPWNFFQGQNWTLKSKTTDIVTNQTANDADFIAGWNDIQEQHLCDANGHCTLTDTWKSAQFQCATNPNNLRQREEWTVVNGVESNHNTFYFACSNATPTPSITMTITPQTSVSSPFEAGDTPHVDWQLSPWSFFQGQNWVLKTKTTDTITGDTVNDPDFIAAWNDIVRRHLCDANGHCTLDDSFQASQFHCSDNPNNVRQREQWVVVNGVESNHQTYYFKCSNATPPTVPSVDIKANGSDGPITVSSDSNVNLTWSFSPSSLANNYTCSASGGWSGDKATSGSQTIEHLTSSKTFTITCTSFVSPQPPTVSDSVVVNVSGVPPIPSINFSRIPQTSPQSPFHAGDLTTVNYQLMPWIFFQGQNWTLKSKTTDVVTNQTINDPDFIAAWTDIANQKLCDVNGHCTLTDTWKSAQFQCATNPNNLRQREEWTVVNGVESNHNTFYFACSNATPTSNADIAITKSVNNQNLLAGASIVYTLVVSALGPATSTAVVATDILPAGLTFVSATSSVGSYTPSTGIWNIGALSASTTATLYINAMVNQGTSGQMITNSVAVGQSTNLVDQNLQNNVANAVINVQSVNPPITSSTADIAITKSVNNASPREGNTIQFTLIVSALGPATSTAVVATDTLPVGLTFVSATSSLGSYSSSTGTWNIGDLSASSTVTLIIAVSVNQGMAGQTITNTASVNESSSIVDSNVQNNVSSASISVGQNHGPNPNPLGGGGGGGGGAGYVNVYSLMINNGDETTATTSVMLTIVATDAAQMMVSNLSDFSDASWESYVTTKSWALTSDAGLKTVYAKFRSATNQFLAAVNDSITLTQPKQGQVLGEATSTVSAPTCGKYLNSYIKLGAQNDPNEVKKLQIFLNKDLGTNLPITGFYGMQTYAAVNQFQLKYNQSVLKPWIPYGLPNDTTPTGYVFKTTSWTINTLMCPQMSFVLPPLPDP